MCKKPHILREMNDMRYSLLMDDLAKYENVPKEHFSKTTHQRRRPQTVKYICTLGSKSTEEGGSAYMLDV